MSVSPEHPTTTPSSGSSPKEEPHTASPGPPQQPSASGPATPGTPTPPQQDQPQPAPPQTVSLDADTNRAAELAMEAATSAPEATAPSAPSQPGGTSQPNAGGGGGSDSAGAGADVKRPKKVWGPRVVEGGREHRKGAVVSVGADTVFLEFGPKELGIIERSNLKEDQVPKVGDQLEVAVQRFDPAESLYICALPGAVQKADWEMLEPGQVVDAMVTGHNKGGLELEVAQHRAFMPASQIDVHRVEDLSQFVGQKLTCKVTRVDRSGRGNITLSRREIVGAERKEQAKKLQETLKEGQEIEGAVRKIMPFGAFVDMGGTDGLLHVSDISHERGTKVEDHVKEGETIRVKVLRLDWEKGRHSLGLKQLQPDPYAEALKEINEGDVVTGRVTKLMDFGAFIEIADGVEGLAHISELDWKRVNKTSDAVQPNTTVKVKVLRIEPDDHKISLSIKQAKERPAGQGPPGGGRGGRGRKGQERDDRSPEEILKETPEFRRLREAAIARDKAKEKRGKPTSKDAGGLGKARGMGMGLGDLKL